MTPVHSLSLGTLPFAPHRRPSLIYNTMGANKLFRAAVSVLLLANAAAADTATSGDFSVLSFNVAGLPAILQDNDESGDKATNTELIGTYFSEYDFDVIHVQEDFNYHAYLCKFF